MRLTINDDLCEYQGKPQTPLIDVLREDLGLTGAKKSCETGECGVCTVLINGNPVNSCLVMVGQISEDDQITTIEGIAATNDVVFQALSKAFAAEAAVQCGFCTPGMVLTAYALLKRNHFPSNAEIQEAIEGNLCRCTGYLSIIRAIQMAAELAQGK